MPRVFTKEQILSESRKEHEKLLNLLAGLSANDLTRPGVMDEWAVKDILVHLTAWEQMVLTWFESGRRGETPQVPAPGFKWNQLPALNRHIFESHREDPLPQVLDRFAASYEQIMAVIEAEPEERLFTPALYPWMNQNAPASYFVSATGSHYRWASKEIKAGLKLLKVK